MAVDLFKGHSASWIAGYKEGNLSGHEHQRLMDSTTIWLMEQDRIDREAWLAVKSMLTGCLLVVVAYWWGKV